MTVQEAITSLKALNLVECPVSEIRELIGHFGQFGGIKKILHKGSTLLRVRANEGTDRYNNREQLSYKPHKYNTTYQRASTPSQTMFYGALMPEKVEVGRNENARIISALEGLNLLRDTDQEGAQLVTFSKWSVTQDIALYSVCHHEQYIAEHPHTADLFELYQKEIATLPKEMQDKSNLITDYLSTEFAKPIQNGAPDYEYMISAIFTEILVKKGQVQGIFYPSVRAEGKGFNVAILPEVADSSLKLDVAGECRIYKRGRHTIGDNETICSVGDDSSDFVYEAVAPELHLGAEKIEELFKQYGL